VGEILTLYTSD